VPILEISAVATSASRVCPNLKLSSKNPDMSASNAIANPSVATESKSAKKKRAKAGALTAAPSGSQGSAGTPDRTDSPSVEKVNGDYGGNAEASDELPAIKEIHKYVCPSCHCSSGLRSTETHVLCQEYP
jgi:hypothetical protein